jgi:hypothetical protein
LCQTILEVEFDERVVDSDSVTEMKSNALKALVSLLEGRPDWETHDQLLDRLEVSLIRRRMIEIYDEVMELEGSKLLAESEQKFEKLDEGCDLMKLVVSLSDVPTAQGKAFKLTLLPKPVIIAGKETPKGELQIKFETAMNKFKWNLRSVEISWNKRIERVYFVLPGSCRYFLESARNRVKHLTDFSSEDRIKPFLARTRDLDDEMRWIQRLNEFNTYRYVGARLDQLKKWSYIMALLMNFVMLISLKQAFKETADGWVETVEYVSELPDFDMDTIMMVFGSIQFITSTLVLGFIVATSAPLVFIKMKRKIKEAEILKAQGRYDTSVIGQLSMMNLFGGLAKCWGGLSTFAICFYCRYGTVSISFVYFSLVIVFIQLPSLLRAYWKMPHSIGFAYYYCCTFDSFCDGKVMFYSVYEACAFAGLVAKLHYAYTFHLMDLIVQSPTLLNVVKAVTNPIQQLTMTTILGVMIIYIFAIFAFYFFQGAMLNNDTGQNECGDVLTCFTMMLHKGLMMGGGIADYMSYELGHIPLTMEPERFVMRIVYDMLFFIVVLVLLLNIIFGIIIDQFGELRDREVEVKKAMLNQCFICNIDKADLDENFQARNISNGFKVHILNEHNMWNYLFYSIYLFHKDITEYTGAEQFVANCLKSEDMQWIPTGKAICMLGDEDAEEYMEVGDVVEMKIEGLKTFMIEQMVRRLLLLIDCSTINRWYVASCY